MAGKATLKPQGGGTEGFFSSLDSLTYREMREVAGLLALQLEGKDASDAGSDRRGAGRRRRQLLR